MDVNNNAFDFMSHRVELQTKQECQCGVSWTIWSLKMIYPMLLSTLPPHTSYNWPNSWSLYVMHYEPNQAGQAAASLRATISSGPGRVFPPRGLATKLPGERQPTVNASTNSLYIYIYIYISTLDRACDGDICHQHLRRWHKRFVPDI